MDLDTFFVSVERLLDPSLNGRPVVVGGERGSPGVVTACSYEVRAFGVRSGMALREASRLAPADAVFLRPRHGVYSPYAKQVKAVLEDYTPVVQTASIDEFYLDFSGCERLYRRPGDADDDATILRVVREMRQAIQDRVGLPASAGIGCTRSVAKMATRPAKPAGVVMVPAGDEWDFLSGLSVRAFPGIGPSAEARLAADGLTTLGQLLLLPPGAARQRHAHAIERLWHAIDGDDGGGLGRDRPAFREHDPAGLTVGSISNERTFFASLDDTAKVYDQLRGLSERVCWRARKRGVRARTLTLKLRTADFVTITRGRTGPPTDVDAHVYAVVRALCDQHWTRQQPIRLLGIALTNLVHPEPQLALPLDGQTRSAAPAIDALRARFGYDAVRLGVARPVNAAGEAPGAGSAEPAPPAAPGTTGSGTTTPAAGSPR